MKVDLTPAELELQHALSQPLTEEEWAIVDDYLNASYKAERAERVDLTPAELQLLTRLDAPSDGQKAIAAAMVKAIVVAQSEGGDRA